MSRYISPDTKEQPNPVMAFLLLTKDGSNYTIGGRRDGCEDGLFIEFRADGDGINVSSISTRNEEDRFVLSVLAKRSTGDGEMRPEAYYYEHIYPTDTIIDTAGALRAWRAESIKCHIVDYWPNSMCKTAGYFVYNEGFDIDPIYIGIHRSYDEDGQLTDAFDADTLPIYERIIY